MATRTPLTLLLDGVLSENAERVDMALSRIGRMVNLETLRENPLRSITALEEIVQALMIHHPQLAKVPTEPDRSLPLHYAARMDSINIVDRLLQRHREGVSVQNAKGKTPLHFAARDGKLNIVKQILQIAPETASIPCDNGKLPLHFACREGHLEICRALLRVHPQGASWQTDKCKVALHFAARWGHLQLAKELLNVYPKGVSILDHEGSLPLHDATRQGQTEMAQYLVPLYPKGLERANVRGETPLFTAVRSGNYELSSFLIQAWPKGGKRVLQSARFDDQVDSWEPELLNMCLHGATMMEKGCGRAEMTFSAAKSDQDSNASTASGTTTTSQDVSNVEVGQDKGSGNNKRPASDISSDDIVPKRCRIEISSKNGDDDDGNDQQQEEEQQPQHISTTTTASSSSFLPLHAALECGASPAVLNHILQKGTNQLMERNRLGMLPLHLLAMHPGNGQNNTNNVPMMIDSIWKRYEQASSVRDNLGRLPLHLALQSRADCRLVECLLPSNSSSSSAANSKEEGRDGGSTNNKNHSASSSSRRGRSLFLDEYPLLMATEYGCDLSTVFLLLREDPSVLKNACPK